MQQCENIVRLYFTPSPDPEEAGLDGKPAKKVIVPEDVRLLDMCTEAAYKHLDEHPYLSHHIQEVIQMPLDELFPDFPSASASIAAAIETGFYLQARPAAPRASVSPCRVDQSGLTSEKYSQRTGLHRSLEACCNESCRALCTACGQRGCRCPTSLFVTLPSAACVGLRLRGLVCGNKILVCPVLSWSTPRFRSGSSSVDPAAAVLCCAMQHGGLAQGTA